MRHAFSMIELIFAIVIIAISVLSIPSMMSIAAQASKISMIDDDVLSRLKGWLIDKSQARWDGNYNASDSGPLWISAIDLNCSRGSGMIWYRVNSDSNVQCNDLNSTPSNIPTVVGNGVGEADGNTSKGIEKLNGGTETISITPTGGGAPYSVSATYAVSYVSSDLTTNGNTATATWILGKSGSMSPAATGTSHLKRVVTQFTDATLGVDTTLTFFKSNKGN
ncbi:type II secretion system protein [Sulfuricurvum sp.]|uniref:type II secretion system protein n=1 Tax=Sulfuricurvum sp. TaxID=2025608 RepID=UPI0035691BA8